LRKRAAGAALPRALAVRFFVQKIHVFFRAKTHVCCIAFLNPKPLPSKPTARMRATAQYVKIELRKTQISQTKQIKSQIPTTTNWSSREEKFLRTSKQPNRPNPRSSHRLPRQLPKNKNKLRTSRARSTAHPPDDRDHQRAQKVAPQTKAKSTNNHVKNKIHFQKMTAQRHSPQCLGSRGGSTTAVGTGEAAL